MAAPSVSQSVFRLVKVLELFEREKRPLSSGQISEYLAAPRSSTAALLRSMQDMSVLGLDRRTMTYLPTARFAQLAAWLSDRMALAPMVTESAKRLMAATLETVTLSAISGLCAELISVERSTLPISFNVEPGARVKLFGSAVGTAYLTILPTPSIKTMYARSQNLPEALQPNESLETSLRRVSEARRLGYAYARGGFVAEASAISAVIPSSLALRPTMLTVAGPTQRMKAKQELIAQALLEEVNILGMGQVTDTLPSL